MSINSAGIIDQITFDWKIYNNGVRYKILIDSTNLESTGIITGIAEIIPGAKLPRHYHESTETYYIISGTGQIEIDGFIKEISAGYAIYIPSNVFHSVECISEIPLTFIFSFPRDSFDQIIYYFDSESDRR